MTLLEVVKISTLCVNTELAESNLYFNLEV